MLLLTIAVILIIIYIIEKISMENALKGIQYIQKPSISVVEPNEEFDIICILQNRTRRFISFLKLREKYSKEIQLCLNDSIKSPKNSNIILEEGAIESSCYLMPKQKLERRIKAYIEKRGRYFLYGATIFGGDFLGINEVPGDYSCIEEIVVIPAQAKIPDIEIILNGYIGDISINRFIFEDPVLTAGFNDYTGQEPQKMISWVQSARVGHLMVKKYDYTLEPMLKVVLNTECMLQNYAELIEECFSIARSVCQFLESRNVKYRFITNATIAGAAPVWASTDYGWGREYLMGILEGLGRALYTEKESFEKMIEKVLDSAELGVGHILITPDITDEYLIKKDKLKERTALDVCVLTPSQREEENVFDFFN